MYENIRVIPGTSLHLFVYMDNVICFECNGFCHFHTKSSFGNANLDGKSASNRAFSGVQQPYFVLDVDRIA